MRLVALIGWLMLGAIHAPNKRGDAENGSIEKTAPVSPIGAQKEIFTPYPGYDPDPCYHAKDSNAGNLCAYWRSAIAAENAVKETRRATDWGIFGIFLSAATLFGLVFTIWLTRGALREARRGNLIAQRANASTTRRSIANSIETERALQHAQASANAAADQVRIAGDVAKRELRAYVTASSANIAITRELKKISAVLTFNLHNSGKTIAVIDFKKYKFKSHGWQCQRESRDQTIISPGGSEVMLIQCGTGGDISSLNIMAKMFIEYRDYLDEPHTEDSVWSCGPEFPVSYGNSIFEIIMPQEDKRIYC